jgi:hypothetical protein
MAVGEEECMQSFGRGTRERERPLGELILKWILKKQDACNVLTLSIPKII